MRILEERKWKGQERGKGEREPKHSDSSFRRKGEDGQEGADRGENYMRGGGTKTNT